MKLLGSRSGRIVWASALWAVAALGCLVARAADTPTTATNNADADKAWRLVVKASQPPFPPAEWQTNAPTAEEQAAFYAPYVVKAADLAKDFYTRFPESPKAADAHKKEHDMLTIATQRFGDTNQVARLAALDGERLKDPNLTDEEREQIEQSRLQARMAGVQQLLMGLPGTYDELDKQMRALQKEFPKQGAPYQVMLMAAEHIGGDKAKSIAKEIAANDAAPDEVKEQAQTMLKMMDAIGKPVPIKFTALDGRQVDLTAMKNKVVLVDFWATWCGPCVGELPHVKEAYGKLHSKGFEIVGISFDQSKDSLEKFVAKEQMEWPQYFDGKGWGNKYGTEFGIHGIPTMWLVDKKGNLRDTNARGALDEKVGKLLEE